MSDHVTHLLSPDRERLVWESATGPVVVEQMAPAHLRAAIAYAARAGIDSPALPAMRERLARLEVS